MGEEIGNGNEAGEKDIGFTLLEEFYECNFNPFHRDNSGGYCQKQAVVTLPLRPAIFWDSPRNYCYAHARESLHISLVGKRDALRYQEEHDFSSEFIAGTKASIERTQRSIKALDKYSVERGWRRR
jgi:hypothetical protein